MSETTNSPTSMSTSTGSAIERVVNAQLTRFKAPACSTRYRCRVESLPDAIHFKMALTPIATEWFDAPELWDEDGSLIDKRNFMPDMNLWFALKNDVSVGQARWLVHQFTDLHVAVQSLKRAEDYDGERDSDVYACRTFSLRARLFSGNSPNTHSSRASF